MSEKLKEDSQIKHVSSVMAGLHKTFLLQQTVQSSTE